MATQISVDVRSLIFGVLVGVVILYALEAWHSELEEASPAEVEVTESPQTETTQHPRVAQREHKQRLEEALRAKVQTMLDKVLGVNRSVARIAVELDFSSQTTETNSVEPGAAQTARREETNEKMSAEHGSEETALRDYEVNRLIESTTAAGETIKRLSMALTVDDTKVIHVESNEFSEVERPDEEIEQLKQLAQRAVGFDDARGDEVTIFALRFDKSQEIQVKEAAVRRERHEFWTGVVITVTKIALIFLALLVLRWIWRRGDATGFANFLKERDSQTALLIATGVFLCAYALRLWGDSLSLGELGALPGLFFLLLGLSRLRRSSSSPQTLQST